MNSKWLVRLGAAVTLAAASLVVAVLPETAVAKSARQPIVWACPDNYEVKTGLNVDFPFEGEKRAFMVYPPQGAAGPTPVWVPLTGSVESTNANLTAPHSGANSLMADKGFMVIGPVRACADQ
jgi:poly(3-hydroxybutyrate) depolymerase